MKQSEELLKNGKVTSSGGRGKLVGGARAQGNAYAYGVNGAFMGGITAATGGKTGTISGGKSNKDPKDYDWIEILISRVEKLIDSLDKQMSSVFNSWSKRNEALKQEYEKILQQLKNQESAYKTYMARAEKVDLNDDYKKKVREGALELEDIQDDKLRKKIDEYKQWIDKALAAEEAQDDLNQKLKELTQQNFDNVIEQYDALIEVVENTTDAYKEQLSIIENQGNFAGQEYYNGILAEQATQLEYITNKIEELRQIRADDIISGRVEEGTQQDKENLAKIREIEAEWLSLRNEMIETQNDAREMDWSIFDKTLDYISEIVSETEFLRDILSFNEADMFSKLSGELTNVGKAIGSLHAVDYATYMHEADLYANKIKDINKQIAEDPTNTILIDKRNEYLKAQQDSIKSANDEKKAIKDLYSQAYDRMLDILKELIDKNKERLRSEKDAYSYQRDVAKQSKNIASLQKQIMALQGDDSESAKSRLQKLQEELEESQEDLRETEYDKWLDDQESMLDNLLNEYSKVIDTRLEDIDARVQEMIDYGNSNAETLNGVIVDAAAELGYTLATSLKDVLAPAYESNGMYAMYDKINNTAEHNGNYEVATDVNKYAGGLSQNVNDMVNHSGSYDRVNPDTEAQLNERIDQAAQQAKEAKEQLNRDKVKYLEDNGFANFISSSSELQKYAAEKDGEIQLTPNYDNLSMEDFKEIVEPIKTKQQEAYFKGLAGLLSASSWTKDKGNYYGGFGTTKYNDGIDWNKINEVLGSKQGEEFKKWYNSKTKDERSKYWSSIASNKRPNYYYSNFKLSDYGVKKYATGGLSTNTGLSWLDGSKLKPERILSAQQTKAFDDLVYSLLPELVNNIPNGLNAMKDINQTVNANSNITFNLPNVTDADSFMRELQGSKKFEKLVQSMTIEQLAGKSSLKKNNIRF